MQTVVFVPLAQGVSGDVINSNSRARCEKCLSAARKCHISSSARVVLAFGAGAIPGKGQKTLAQYTEDFFVGKCVDFPMIVNRDDKKVYGTLQEILWAIRSAEKLYKSPRFVIVSQARHILRVRLMHRWFFPQIPTSFMVSGHTEEVPLYHEFFAYSKLVLIKLGLGVVAEKTRIFTARFTKW